MDMKDLCQRVNSWAKDNATSDYNYGSRQSYWAAAVSSGIITSEEYKAGETYYGTLWTYRGD